MIVKKFQAETETEAILKAKDELGSGAVAVSYTHLDVYKRQDAIEGVDLRVIGESETSPVLTMDASGITMFSEKTNLNSELGINGLGKGKAVGKMTSVGVCLLYTSRCV